MRFGEELRTERERRGIALDDIAVATRVSLRNLHALEAERFQELPGGVFNRGMIRAYARFCGMDEDGAIDAYSQALRSRGVDPEMEHADWATFAENVGRNRPSLQPQRRLRWLGVAAMVLGMLLVAGAVYLLLVYRGVVAAPPRVHDLLHRVLRTTGMER